MGLSKAEWCNFIVYVYSGLIIIRVDFDEEYFKKVLEKLSTFYKDYILQYFINL